MNILPPQNIDTNLENIEQMPEYINGWNEAIQILIPTETTLLRRTFSND